MSSQYSIEKLDDDNYSSWAVQMKSLLIHSELWGIVSGREIKSEGDTVEQQTNFDRKDEKALASVLLCIKPSQINHVKHCTRKLGKCWQLFRIQLFKQLLYMKMSESEGIAKHVNNFSDVIEKLNEIQKPVPDEMLVIILLASLSDAYEGFVIVIEARDNLPSFGALKNKLLEEGERRKTVEQIAVKEEQKMFASRCENDKNNKNKRDMKNIECWKCGRRGHISAKCRSKEKSATSEKDNDSDKKNDSNKKSYSVFAAASHKSTLSVDVWCMDSGATAHLCANKSLFVSIREHKEKIMLVGEQYIEAKGIGTVKLNWHGNIIELIDVLYVQNLQCNFVSVAKAINNGFKICFEQDEASVKNKKGDTVLIAKKQNDLFVFENENKTAFAAKANLKQVITWHNRFGHLNFNSIKSMINKDMVYGLPGVAGNASDFVCETCAKSKICVKQFPKTSENRSREILGLIHTDICGPISTVSKGGARYFATFIDDKTRYVTVYMLKSKDQVFEKFKEFKALAEKQTGQKIKAIRSDNGREYLSGAFENFLVSQGIKRQLTVPHTPQQNGVAELAHRTLVEMARSMLVHARANESLWGNL